MSAKRKRYSAAEKSKIALEAIKGELTMAQIASKYSVHPVQVNAWKKQAIATLPDVFSNKRKAETSAHEGELADLYQQIGRLTIENNFLKKKFDTFHG